MSMNEWSQWMNGWSQDMSVNEWIMKHIYTIYISYIYLSTIRKKEILPFVAKWGESDNDKCCMKLLICGI